MNRRKELVQAMSKEAIWFPGKTTLLELKEIGSNVAKAAKNAGEVNVDKIVDKVLLGTEKVIDNATSKIIKEMRFTGIVGLGAAGVGAGIAGAVAGPFANRFHRELQAVEKATGLPISGDISGQSKKEVPGAFVEGFTDKAKKIVEKRLF